MEGDTLASATTCCRLHRWSANHIGMTLFKPSDVTAKDMLEFGKQTYGTELLITGVPINGQGESVWETVGDLVRFPHDHGLLASIETIVQVHRCQQWVAMYSDEQERLPEGLRVRFAATIDEAFDGHPTTQNPAAWIHLGHGQLEHSFELLEDLEEWEDEEYETIPGLSNGHEDEDYRSAKDIRKRISGQRGNILFMALPLCYGQQIAATLCETGRIHLVHANTSFAVTDGLQFYDGVDHPERTHQSLASWSEWVVAVEKAWRGAARVLLLGKTP